MRSQRGFTFMEILVALTIVSILAVIAVPMYLDYDVRAKVIEGFSIADPVKSLVSDYYMTMGIWPDSNPTAGAEDPASYKTDYVDSISVTAGGAGATITITYRIPALGNNNTIILEPSNTATHSLLWNCTGGTVVNKYRPTICKS